MRRGVVAVALAVAGTCWLATMPSAAVAGIDRSFGVNGVVHIDPVFPGYQRGQVPEMATGPDGGIYLRTHAGCSAGPGCQTDLFLTRLKADGQPDAAYGGGPGRVKVTPPGNWQDATFAVDSLERQLVAIQTATEIVVTRLLPNGAVDGSFGVNGRSSIPCDCEFMSMRSAVVFGDRFQVVGDRLGSSGNRSNQQVLLARLSPTGDPDRRFGNRGKVRATIAGSLEPATVEVLPNGAVIFAGTFYGGTISRPNIMVFAQRFDPRGRLDPRFAKNVRRAIGSLPVPDQKAPHSVHAAIPRRGGAIDLLGVTDDLGSGYALRVHASGRIDRGFGNRGIRLTKWDVWSAAADPAGHVLASGVPTGSNAAIAFWLGRDGAFHPPAARVKGLEPLNTEVVMQGKRPLLFDPDSSECRSYCAPHPKLVRLEPWAR